MDDAVFYATGKRKSSIAKVWLKPGSGNIIVNKKKIDDYFNHDMASYLSKAPLLSTKNETSVDIKMSLKGGGLVGQAGAARNGISKALILYNPELRDILKKAGFVARDSRVKERKKYGQKGARARFQFSKR